MAIHRNFIGGGDVKGSGHGREKGFEALYGFGALKTVAIRHGVL